MLQTFANLRGLLGILISAQHSCSGRDVLIQMVNHVIPGQKKTNHLTSCLGVDPLRTFLSEGFWVKPKSQLSEVAFGRGRATGLVRGGFKEEIMGSEAVGRLNIYLAQAHEEGG